MSETAIRAQIKATLEGVTGIGVVSDRVRLSRSQAELEKLATDNNDRVNVWEIHREGVGIRRQTGGRVIFDHRYRAEGYYALDDEDDSDGDFQDLLENILTAFTNNPRLSATCRWSDPSIEDISWDLYGGRLCHKAELVLSVEEQT